MEIIKDNCLHEKFQSNCRIGRLTEVESGPVTSYTMDVEVHCAECMMPFQFIGLPGGVNPSFPTVSADNLEARIPIKPL